MAAIVVISPLINACVSCINHRSTDQKVEKATAVAEQSKDISTNVAETQKNEVKVQVGKDTAEAFAALKTAATQPVIQPPEAK